MKKILEQFKIIKTNFKTLFYFELIFKLLITLLFIPTLINGFALIMKITNYNYLTIENIFSFLINPITLIFILLLIVCLTFVTLFDFGTIIVIYDASINKIKIGVLDSIINSFNRCKEIFKFKNILLAFLLVFLIPFLNFGCYSNVITTIKIPEFITDFIYNNIIFTILISSIYILLFILLMKWMYTIHYIILEKKDFIQASKCSSNLSKGNRIKDFIKIILFQVFFSLAYFLILLLGIFVIYLFNKILASFKVIESVFITVVGIFMILLILLYIILSNSISYLFITGFFYNHKYEKKEKNYKYDYIVKKNEHKKNHIFKCALIIACIVFISLGSYFTFEVISEKINLNIEYTRIMELTAHRGASAFRPENTMSSFRLAQELGADYIELDVQQTKDKKIVVSHDTNLLRVAGVNKNIIDLTYDEISKYDVGSFFAPEYKDEVIPLLSDVIEFAKNKNIKLNIELKPTGNEVDFEKEVVTIINNFNYGKKCVVTSQEYEVLKNIKEYDKNIKTIYVMSIAIGDMSELIYADGFSVEASNVNSALVSNIHNSGKEIYAWTVNTEDSINQMINMNVDNIITDNITLGRKVLIESKQSNLVKEFIKYISNI